MLGIQELVPLLILAVILLFAAPRLPKLARSMREARDEFKKGSSDADGKPESNPEAKPDASGQNNT